MIEESGLPVAPDIELVPNARKSLVLAELARDEGRFDTYAKATFEAYWAHGRDIGDDEVLLELAGKAGMDEHEARAELLQQQRLDRVLESSAQMTALGGTGVPAWVIDQKMLVPGAQPHEVFERILEKLGHQPLASASE